MSENPPMRAVVDWNGDLTFVGYGPNQRGVIVDGGTDDGGLGLGPSPMELMLIGVGACASIDIVLILKKSRQSLVKCRVEVTGQRADEPPRRFLNCHLKFMVSGQELAEKQVARAVELSMEKYCSASATLAAGIPVTHEWQIES